MNLFLFWTKLLKYSLEDITLKTYYRKLTLNLPESRHFFKSKILFLKQKHNLNLFKLLFSRILYIKSYFYFEFKYLGKTIIELTKNALSLGYWVRVYGILFCLKISFTSAFFFKSIIIFYTRKFHICSFYPETKLFFKFAYLRCSLKKVLLQRIFTNPIKINKHSEFNFRKKICFTLI